MTSPSPVPGPTAYAPVQVIFELLLFESKQKVALFCLSQIMMTMSWELYVISPASNGLAQ